MITQEYQILVPNRVLSNFHSLAALFLTHTHIVATALLSTTLATLDQSKVNASAGNNDDSACKLLVFFP